MTRNEVQWWEYRVIVLNSSDVIKGLVADILLFQKENKSQHTGLPTTTSTPQPGFVSVCKFFLCFCYGICCDLRRSGLLYLVTSEEYQRRRISVLNFPVFMR
jgi:hypothetical protein